MNSSCVPKMFDLMVFANERVNIMQNKAAGKMVGAMEEIYKYYVTVTSSSMPVMSGTVGPGAMTTSSAPK